MPKTLLPDFIVYDDGPPPPVPKDKRNPQGAAMAPATPAPASTPACTQQATPPPVASTPPPSKQATPPPVASTPPPSKQATPPPAASTPPPSKGAPDQKDLVQQLRGRVQASETSIKAITGKLQGAHQLLRARDAEIADLKRRVQAVGGDNAKLKKDQVAKDEEIASLRTELITKEEKLASLHLQAVESETKQQESDDDEPCISSFRRALLQEELACIPHSLHPTDVQVANLAAQIRSKAENEVKLTQQLQRAKYETAGLAKQLQAEANKSQGLEQNFLRLQNVTSKLHERLRLYEAKGDFHPEPDADEPDCGGEAGQLDTLREELEKAIEDRAAALAKVTKMERHIHSLQGSLKQKDAALGGLYPRVVELEARLAQAQKQTTKADTVQLETARPETVQPCNCAEAHEAIIKSIKDAWQQEVSGLQQRLDASESRTRELLETNESLRNEVESQKKAKKDKIFFLDIDQPRDALKKIKKKLLHNDKSTPGIARTESDPLAGAEAPCLRRGSASAPHLDAAEGAFPDRMLHRLQGRQGSDPGALGSRPSSPVPRSAGLLSPYAQGRPAASPAVSPNRRYGTPTGPRRPASPGDPGLGSPQQPHGPGLGSPQQPHGKQSGPVQPPPGRQ
eukprot:CAMPEP_0174346008 /NCGR_PEP_ID=MMETSP0811_2-20130205/1561_1 /TAXON_ID=73025 ORGANISM="Eutreptiella gymnastica-like, Strain CCMP1594" /NCGR_SAMPLE_ID=MMETSP0811_2 /ASSEMBLY_ACC=CAM_ASM_000667 /LENGTH=625 /DNA_ID=CAMNT_0015470139 /DNA_START=51 /DNA_END=1925 /DNA_ORIENTATION=+